MIDHSTQSEQLNGPRMLVCAMAIAGVFWALVWLLFWVTV